MSFRPYIIQVSGSVVAKEGKHYTQNWVACACSEGNIELTPFVYSEKKHSIIGDVFFDKKRRAVPYALYVANGSVGIQEGAGPDVDLSCYPGFYPAFAYFYEYIEEVRMGVDVLVEERIRDMYLNGLYIGAFSVLELFLCDFLLCGVFFKEAYYQNALRMLGVGENPDQYVVEEKIKNVVYRKVFHNFEEVEELFQGIFDFGFPDWKEFKKRIYRRHNIVHRYALSNKDRMTVCDATSDDVRDLIETIGVFVEDMKACAGRGDYSY
jgi:hypothetical protein